MKAKPAEGSGSVTPGDEAGNVPFPSMADAGKRVPCTARDREQWGDEQRSPLQQLEEQSSSATSLVPLPAQAPAAQLPFPCTPEHRVHVMPCSLVLEAQGTSLGWVKAAYLALLGELGRCLHPWLDHGAEHLRS